MTIRINNKKLEGKHIAIAVFAIILGGVALWGLSEIGLLLAQFAGSAG